MTAPRIPAPRVHGHDTLVAASFCLHPFPRNRWCLRIKGHDNRGAAGGCIAWGPFPIKHMNDTTTYARRSA